jgi:hydrogenase maturation protein HypF
VSSKKHKDRRLKNSGLKIHVTGVVQGVGFRPFVYSLAQRHHLTGWVKNTSAGVDIEVDGAEPVLKTFAASIIEEAPPLARIDELNVTSTEPVGFSDFEIIQSEAIKGAFQPISPDVCVCADCLREMADPEDRRYRYPFINCTNCGPRFTIIEDIPYDRPYTTMAPFEMCSDCALEYRDPLDRRFHAQPVACPECGPHVWLETARDPADVWRPLPVDEQSIAGDDAVKEARRLLNDGYILAVKGLGGFHLACDASNTTAVLRLRERKLRVDKPFAVMMADSETVSSSCLVGETELGLLTSRERPIVVMKRLDASNVVPEVAPGQNTIGVMLPYTPLHYLLLEKEAGYPEALVMTSGNLSEEPIATHNEEALARLSGIADAFLLHNRGIRTRCDDSVVRVFELDEDRPSAAGQSSIYPLRRSRGYAPFPIKLSGNSPPILATGAELKNAFCLTNDRYAFLSHHIGDMENLETLKAFEDGIDHLERLFRIKPQVLAYDLHPNYLASRYAQERAAGENIPSIGIQHHYAHIASCMAEHNLPEDRPVIGISFDGTGYGEDGAIWGGEVLVADFESFQRAYHLMYTPLPGGDRAIREPWRMALSWLASAGIEWDADLPPVRYIMAHQESTDALSALRQQIRSGLNAPSTSSMGRLFDAVSALSGVRQIVNYEAQAAIEFEALADPFEKEAYPLALNGDLIDPRPLLREVVKDVRAGTGLPSISGRLHNGLAQMVAAVSAQVRHQHQISDVILSGGVWQNMTLLHKTFILLESQGFNCFVHHKVPANDGGLALGQAAIAAHRFRGK